MIDYEVINEWTRVTNPRATTRGTNPSMLAKQVRLSSPDQHGRFRCAATAVELFRPRQKLDHSRPFSKKPPRLLKQRVQLKCLDATELTTPIADVFVLHRFRQALCWHSSVGHNSLGFSQGRGITGYIRRSHNGRSSVSATSMCWA